MTDCPSPGLGDVDRQSQIRALFDEYIEMYSPRDDRLTDHFGDIFSGYTSSSDFLARDREEWVRITRQDFAQVPDRIRIEVLDLVLQELSHEVVMATALLHVHLPSGGQLLAREAVRLTLVFRLEGAHWRIVHSGISVPYQRTQAGEVYPLKRLQEHNSELLTLVEVHNRRQALHAGEVFYKLLTEDTQDVIWMADARLRITYISPADERLRGFRADEVVGHHVFEMFTVEGAATVKRMLDEGRKQGRSGWGPGFLRFELEHRCKDGRLIWGEVLSKPDRSAQGEIVGYHGITREITNRKLLEEQVRALAFNDSLTQLCNRRRMVERLTQAISSSKRTRLCGALLFLDLDNFKSLNDRHGHAAGDLLLIEVARRLQSCVREVDTVARFGGDEFVVLLSELSAERDQATAQAAAVAEKLRVCLAAPYLLESLPAGATTDQPVEHHCTASIGVALYCGNQVSENELIDCADSAMYLAKEAGRNCVRVRWSIDSVAAPAAS
jgi:diguanylate cyclase (GGDEF)-like protein/PAS domain S-box-containing protein